MFAIAGRVPLRMRGIEKATRWKYIAMPTMKTVEAGER
jgi:hypothetical protein